MPQAKLTLGTTGTTSDTMELRLTPHNSPLGGQGALKFLCVTEAYRPYVHTKYQALQFKGGHGGRHQRNFAVFGGRPRGQAVLGPPRG